MEQAEARLPLRDPEAFLARLRPGDRLFGLDVGTKTVGIALSDVTLMIASGFETLLRGKKFGVDAAELLRLAAREGVGGFVVGLPVNLDGRDGPRAQATRAFARNFARLTPHPVLLWDERLTTQEAERLLISADASRKRRAEVIDKVAATLILQGALDRIADLRRRALPEGTP
ncbi:MAG: Holliday junction resolvase RuvX [Hyphomicrobiaceae bacterium]|nr:Holliday junction resolvase RuvX [Hyphomicrobiaceae bacterium]